MLRGYIERREMFLHGRDNNRRSLPFEWGTEHLGITSNGDSATVLEDYVSRALRDSESFYACEPAAAYEIDGEILKFPSAVETPYPENNTVHALWFPAAASAGGRGEAGGADTGAGKSLFATIRGVGGTETRLWAPANAKRPTR